MAQFLPYPIDGTVVDTDGSTAVAATVVILNTTTAERISLTAETDGTFLLDLANLTSGYTNSDKIQITVFFGAGTAMRSLSRRHTVNTAQGSYSVGTMVLHWGADPFGSCYITFASHTNSSGAGLWVDFYDRINDAKIMRIETATGNISTFPIGYLGVKADGGFIRIFESETSRNSEVLTVVK